MLIHGLQGFQKKKANGLYLITSSNTACSLDMVSFLVCRDVDAGSLWKDSKFDTSYEFIIDQFTNLLSFMNQ